MSFSQPAFSVKQRDFGDGFLDVPETDTLPLSATGDARNCLLISAENTLRRRAVIRRRTGATLLNASAIASRKSVDGLFEFLRENAAGQLLAACNGSVYLYDNISAFGAVTGGTGFTAGNAIRMAVFRNNAFLCDGTQNLRYNGTQCWTVGFIAPTAAPGLADGGVSGSLTGGTYEGIAVWYDSTMDHESDWSAIAATVTLAAGHARQWTKPAGSPPANVDKWRIYARRTDTFERNYYLVGTVPIATATLTESISDGGRTIPSANINENLPPSVAFAVMQEWNGFCLAVPPASSMLNVSKQFDAESWNPKNQFPVGGKGDSKPVRSIRKYGEECVIAKPRASYRVTAPNTTLPFAIKPIHSSLGNVSQEAALEVRGWLYAWDEVIGPYRTNLVDWLPLADNRIANARDAVNKLALDQIRAEHYPSLNLIVWAVPTTSRRKRTLLAYHYVLDRWLPPMTGLEYCSLTQFTSPAGATGLYAGDYWGRVYQLFSGEVDGVPSGSLIARVSAATNGTLTADFEQTTNANGTLTTTGTAAAFYTTGDGLAGMPFGLLGPDGSWQWGIIASNTATVLTIDTVNGALLAPVPSGTGWTVVVGAINGYWKTGQIDHGQPDLTKVARWFWLQARMTSPAFGLKVDSYLDLLGTLDQTFYLSFPVSGLAWGVGKWGDLWGGGAQQSVRKHRLERSYSAVQFRISNPYPNQPWIVTMIGQDADPLPGRRAASA